MRSTSAFLKALLILSIFTLSTACTDVSLKPKEAASVNGGGGTNAQPCTDVASGQVVQSGDSITLYVNNIGTCEEICDSPSNRIVLTCNDGQFIGAGNALNATSLMCMDADPGSCTPEPTAFDNLEFIDMAVQDGQEQSLLNFLAEKNLTDEDGDEANLTTQEENLIRTFDPASPTFSVRYKFLSSDTISIRTDPNNFTQLIGALPVDNFRYLLELDFVSRKVFVDSLENPTNQIYTYTQWLSAVVPGFPLPLATGINQIRIELDSTVGLSSVFSKTITQITANVEANDSDIEDIKINLIFKASPTSTPITVLKVSDPAVNSCPYLDESLLEDMCQ